MPQTQQKYYMAVSYTVTQHQSRYEPDTGKGIQGLGNCTLPAHGSNGLACSKAKISD